MPYFHIAVRAEYFFDTYVEAETEEEAQEKAIEVVQMGAFSTIEPNENGRTYADECTVITKDVFDQNKRMMT